MKIHEIMTKTVECADGRQTIAAAARKMNEQDVGALPVIEEGVPVGLVTDRDIVRRAVARGTEPARVLVRDVMTHNLAWCPQDADVEQAARIMKERGVRRLLVHDEMNRISGILSLSDLAGTDVSEVLAASVLGSICQDD